MAKQKRKGRKVAKGRAPMPPPSSRHKDKKKEADKKLARQKVTYEDR